LLRSIFESVNNVPTNELLTFVRAYVPRRNGAKALGLYLPKVIVPILIRI